MRPRHPVVLICTDSASTGIQSKNQNKSFPDPEWIRHKSWQLFIQNEIMNLWTQFAGDPENCLLVTDKANLLGIKEKPGAINYLEIASVTQIFNHFRLWQWQRKHPRLHILALGDSSLPLALKLAKKSKSRDSKTYGLFYLPIQKNIKLLPLLNECICTSETVRESFPETVTQPLFCLPGISFGEIANVAGIRNANNNFVFGMAESLCAGSGALTVIRAMAAIWQIAELPPWEVRMFGSGSRFQQILEEAEKLGVNSRLSLLGNQQVENVAPLCDAWIAPGHDPLETPTALWAGICANLPTISTSTPLHNSWLPTASPITISINPENPQALAAAMLEILKNPEKRHQLICAAQIWKKEISIKAMCRRIQNILINNE